MAADGRLIGQLLLWSGDDIWTGRVGIESGVEALK
jgi:hypothetical protein